MSIMMLSFWRNDVRRRLGARITHLLLKQGPVRWVWVVGDSMDETERVLRNAAGSDSRVIVIRHDTGVIGDSPMTRLRRLSQTADMGLAQVRTEDVTVLIHESDIESPPNIGDRLESGPEEAVAAWPTLTLLGQTLFYDTWAYRLGVSFSNHAPYHPSYRPDRRFEVDSVGTCWSMPAWAIRSGARCEGLGAVGLCRSLRQRGVRILVDPQVPVVQPISLWTAQVGAEVPG